MQKLIEEKKAENALSVEQCESEEGAAEIERVINKMNETPGYRLGSKSDAPNVEKMELGSPEPPQDRNENMEDDEDAGEIHIVSD